MAKRLLIIFLALIILVNISYAADIKTYQAGFNIAENKVVVEVDVLFNEKTTDVLEFELPDDYKALSVYIDDESVISNVEDNILKIELNENSKVSFNYITEELTDKTNFLMNLNLNFDADNLIVKLILPEGASLKTPIKEADLTSGSIYPQPSKATTDGRSLMFYWLRQDVKQGDDVSIFAQIDSKDNYLGLIFLIAGIVIIILGLYLLVSNKKPITIVKKEDMVENHLKQDEEQVVNILKQREGSCEQGTLRIVTGFSKATLSRILMELEDRKVIHKEKRGKKNLIFLKT